MRSTSWWRSLGLFERLCLAAWAGLLGAAALAPAGLGSETTLCLVRALTGLRCPGCGMGHALLASLRGQLGPAWDANPFGPALALLWTAWVLHGAANALRGRPFSAGVRAPGTAVAGLAAAALLA
ncbi:MAG: DUF2752 domain-containing protein, partial [Elusimicrobia bacterium]|nr:DUF2752 domain-containing protein [Elusimicrobiota bacterium]